MEPTKLTATKRDTRGKGPARRMRSGGAIPAIAYGAKMDPISLSVSPEQLKEHLQGEYGINTVFDLEVDGSTFPAIVADYQYHPVSRELLHADFKRIDLQKEIEVEVPFRLTGKSKGVTAGGTLQQAYRALPIRALPLSVPVEVVHDMTNVGIDEVVSAADIVLPEGVVLTLPGKRTVAGVYAAKYRAKEEGEGEGTEAAAAAAPAKGAAPAKPAG